MNIKRNMRVLAGWEALASTAKRVKLLAYFGTDEVPGPTESPNENAVLRRYGNSLSHPNLKRGDLVKWLKSNFTAGIDARLVTTKQPQLRGPALNDRDFPLLMAKSMFNINVSGLRRSIPFRFVDSFTVGTAIVTDELAVKWYRPFEEGVELFRIGRLGYELPQDTEWDRAHECLTELYHEAEQLSLSNRERILENYRNYWHPESFARYILQECEQVA